jgi:pimeloyl-ACP methyl ester carboxylesterase
MKNIIAAVCVSVAVLLAGCVTAGPNNLSTYYKNTSVSAELYYRGQIIDLKTFEIHKPNNKIAVLFNHGTASNFNVSTCRPSRFPVSINALLSKTIYGQEFLIFHLCSYSFEYQETLGSLHKTRAQEISLAVQYLTEKGISREKIIVAGQSWGGWSALYYFAKYKPDIIGVITFAPGIHGRTKDRRKQSSVIKKAVEFFKDNRINGLVFSHPEDGYFPTDPFYKFVKDVNGLTLITDEYCTDLSVRRAHSFMYRDCSEQHNKLIFDFIKIRMGLWGK